MMAKQSGRNAKQLAVDFAASKKDFPTHFVGYSQ
jgi:hypothetical protein